MVFVGIDVGRSFLDCAAAPPVPASALPRRAPNTPGGVAALAAALAALGPELARMAQGLAPVPGVEGALLLSDADPSRRMILGDLARVLAGWSGPGRHVLALSPEGLRLTLRGRMDRASRMEAFVDLAFDLSRVIGP